MTEAPRIEHGTDRVLTTREPRVEPEPNLAATSREVI